MFKDSTEDASSIAGVLAVLESEAAKLGPKSKLVHLWRDWTDLLTPTVAGQTDRALALALEYVTPPSVATAITEVAA